MPLRCRLPRLSLSMVEPDERGEGEPVEVAR